MKNTSYLIILILLSLKTSLTLGYQRTPDLHLPVTYEYVYPVVDVVPNLQLMNWIINQVESTADRWVYDYANRSCTKAGWQHYAFNSWNFEDASQCNWVTRWIPVYEPFASISTPGQAGTSSADVFSMLGGLLAQAQGAAGTASAGFRVSGSRLAVSVGCNTYYYCWND